MAYIDIPLSAWAKGKVFNALAGVKVIWQIWNLRILTLVSLGLQMGLLILAPFRKQTSNTLALIIIWSSYLVAAYVASLAVGIIPNISKNSTNDDSAHPRADLLALWSTFLLLHDGGPDTLTALSLEDNDQWVRTGIHLVIQVSSIARAFAQSFPSNTLWLPTILLFLAGVIKYIERTLSMYSARISGLRSSLTTAADPDPGPNYAKMMSYYDSLLKSAVPVSLVSSAMPVETTGSDDEEEEEIEIITDAAPVQTRSPTRLQDFSPVESAKVVETTGSDHNDDDDDDDVKSWVQDEVTAGRLERNAFLDVRNAFNFFQVYKGLYVGLLCSFEDWKRSWLFFNNPNLRPSEAFTVIEIELNLAYEMFFTKMVLIHQQSRLLKKYRCVYYSCILLSILSWILLIDKLPFNNFDVLITYTLFGGSIIIDASALLITACSYWNIAKLGNVDDSSIRVFFYTSLLSAGERTWGPYWQSKGTPWGPWLRRLLFRRWSESVFQVNLISYCTNPWSDRADRLFKILPFAKDTFEGFKYVSKRWFADDLRDFIFSELQCKSRLADEPREAAKICDSRGSCILGLLAGHGFDPFRFFEWTEDVDYDECLLLWHIATELLYQDKVYETETFSSGNNSPNSEESYREYSKALSDYMMYLLKRQPRLVFAVLGISEIRIQDTCAELSRFCGATLPTEAKRNVSRHQSTCNNIMEVNMTVKPREMKWMSKSKSVLFDACCLAKELKKLEYDSCGMWEVVARVWVELLCYAATNSKVEAHAGQLKQGGELLSLIWLMMVHFGLGKQFHNTPAPTRQHQYRYWEMLACFEKQRERKYSVERIDYKRVVPSGQLTFAKRPAFYFYYL